MFSVTVDILWDESHLTVQCELVTTLLVCDDTNFFPVLLDKKKDSHSHNSLCRTPVLNNNIRIKTFVYVSLSYNNTNALKPKDLWLHP